MRYMKVLAGALLLMLCLSFTASPGQCALTHTLTAESGLEYGESGAISMLVSIGNGDGWYNGTVYCNITGQDGVIHHLGSKTVTFNNTAKTTYFNWSTGATHVSGTWNVTIDFKKTSGAGTVSTGLADHYGSFTVERAFQTTGRLLNNLAVVIFSLVMVMAFIFVMLIVWDRAGKKS